MVGSCRDSCTKVVSSLRVFCTRVGSIELHCDRVVICAVRMVCADYARTVRVSCCTVCLCGGVVSHFRFAGIGVLLSLFSFMFAIEMFKCL